MIRPRVIAVIACTYVAIFLAGCENEEKSAVSFKTIGSNKVLVLDIDNIKETRDVRLSELVDSAMIIQLSGNDDALLGTVCSSSATSDHLFFTDMNNSLFMFDINGNYIRSWNQGNGPNEFLIPANPKYIDGRVYVQDLIRGQLIEYNLEYDHERTIRTVKRSGKSYILNNEKILSVGVSESSEDPYIVCLQDFGGKVLQSVKAMNKLRLASRIAGESVIVYKDNKGWNIHYPTNDTLMHYNVEENTLSPIAVFESKSKRKTNIHHYLEREESDLRIGDEDLCKVLIIVPEFENSRYYFLSVYRHGADNTRPWYMTTREICLLDKISHTAFYVNIVNDIWTGIPFRTAGDIFHWSKYIVQDFPAITIKKIISNSPGRGSVGECNKDINGYSVLSNIEDSDNNIVFWYRLKE